MKEVLYVAAAVATLLMFAGAIWQGLKQSRSGEPDPLPTASQRSQFSILVVDDKKFEHVDRLRRDGFDITFRNDLDQFIDIDDFQFDLILMDLHGVGLKLSDDGGRGVIRHIKKISPTQLVLAYTAHQGSPSKFEGVFKDADEVLDKGASYLSFKTSIEENLERLRSPEHFMDRALADISISVAARERLRSVFCEALNSETLDAGVLEELGELKVEHRELVKRALHHAVVVGKRLRSGS